MNKIINNLHNFKIVDIIDTAILTRVKFQLKYHSFAVFTKFKKGSCKAVLILDGYGMLSI